MSRSATRTSESLHPLLLTVAILIYQFWCCLFVDVVAWTCRHLDLSNNSFSGSIPTVLLTLTSLTFLCMNTNALSGSLPTDITVLSKLSRIDFSSQSGEGLSGTALPPTIGNLTPLR